MNAARDRVRADTRPQIPEKYVRVCRLVHFGVAFIVSLHQLDKIFISQWENTRKPGPALISQCFPLIKGQLFLKVSNNRYKPT